uniref:Uncharacterized protein n=1 Tax=Anguilla anguilla TaxID=7936 RepID=A0A0E9S127_ANGAN
MINTSVFLSAYSSSENCLSLEKFSQQFGAAIMTSKMQFCTL